jgi:hypothetical protein
MMTTWALASITESGWVELRTVMITRSDVGVGGGSFVAVV